MALLLLSGTGIFKRASTIPRTRRSASSAPRPSSRWRWTTGRGEPILRGNTCCSSFRSCTAAEPG